MAMSDEDKYKRPEVTATDVAVGSAIPAYATAKAVGGGSAMQGAKTIGKGLWNTAKATGIGAKATASGLGTVAKGIGVRALPAVSAGVATAYTPTEDYYERFGFDKNTVGDSFAKDVGVRALGFASDLGNAFTLGQAGKYLFQDKIRQNNEATQAQPQPSPSSNTNNQNHTTQTSEQNTTQNPSQFSQAGMSLLQTGGLIGKLATNTPQATPYQGGLKAENPNYHALMRQIEQAGQAMMKDQNKKLGIDTYAPQRGWENEAQRKDLLRQATTVHKGANGLTAAQMRLAHDLSNDDIKMEQERHLQQNQLNHQLQQEQLQQQAQNQRALLGETGQTARAIMNEQGQNARFNQNFGLDVAKFNQDAQNSQYELGLKGADLRSRLQSQALDDSAKAEQMSLYNQYINAKDDEQRDKILTNMAVLTGRGGGNGGDSFATMNLGEQYDPETQMTINRGQALYNTRTGQVVGGQGGQPQQQGNPDWHKDPNILKAIEQINKKGGTADEIRQAYIQAGVPADQVDAILAQQKGA